MNMFLRSVLPGLAILLSVSCVNDTVVPSEVPETPWPESFGNHRAVLNIDDPAEVWRIEIPWRRHDSDPKDKMLLIVSAESGDTIPNIHRIRVDNEWGQVLAGPMKSGLHYLYFMPYETQAGYGNYRKNYFPPEAKPDADWLENMNLESVPAASLSGLEARTEFNSFYPMEVIPFESEKTEFLQNHPEPFLLFTEDRSNPVRMRDEIPFKWIRQPNLNQFKGTAQRNEYYVYQVALYAVGDDVNDLKVEFLSLQGPGKESIGPERFTCFNTEGVDTYGRSFQKSISVKKGSVKPLWMGIDIPEDIRPGKYIGTVMIGPAAGKMQTVDITLKIKDDILADRGDNEPWRHSRLRWLNSTLGLDNEPVAPYTPIKQQGDLSFKLFGKQILLDTSALPASIRIGETEVLNRSIGLTIQSDTDVEQFSIPEFMDVQSNRGKVSGKWTCSSDHFSLTGKGAIESDGYLSYRFHLKAVQDISLKDIRLEIPFNPDIAEYLMGMGLPGTTVPKKHESSWNGPEDSFWLGNTIGGIWVELRGSTYHGPLLNLYRPAPPESWDNHGKGGFRVESGKSEVVATVFSGPRELKKGEEVEYEFALLITPVKPLNTKSQFTDRYYHNGGVPDPAPEDLEAGIRIINLHHANQYNPYINYPFIAVDEMKSFVDRYHEKGIKVKIYYTIRELTNYVTEIWALRSLGDEILGEGPGGGYPWLREHFVSGYMPQWYQHFDDGTADASVLTATGESRWFNYYIEGLGWLVRNLDIDGLYLDDVSFDRHILKRMRKVMEYEKPGSLIDLHSNTGFSKGPVKQYAEFFPYVDKIWFGESFQYDQMPPDNWLVEVSGIPFGLMGDMLHGGGNRWLGMVYGMTVRHPWYTEGVICDPRPIWKIWDEFGIEESLMSGFWESDPVVRTGASQVKATAFVKQNQVLIALGNFSDQSREVSLQYDWQQIHLDPGNVELTAPEIEDFQENRLFKPTEKIRIEPRKGYLLYLKEKGQN